MSDSFRRLAWVVGAIVLILAFSLPIIHSKAVRHAEALQAQAIMRAFIEAMEAYQTENQKLPIETFSSTAERGIPKRTRGLTLQVLLGTEDKLNRRHIQFFDPSFPGEMLHNDGQHDPVLVDPWGEPYYFMIDSKGKVPNPDPRDNKDHPFIETQVIMFSAGPDRDPTTWDDNILSWK
jgi:type II secretory pathway pseudopilin PulG